MNLKNSLLKETFMYTATDAVSKALSFILLPFVSFYLVPDELGIATNYTVLVSITSLLSGLALANSIPYFYYEQTKEENRELVSNIFIIVAGVCTFFFLLLTIFHSYVTYYLKLPLWIQFLAVVQVMLYIITCIDLVLFRLENKVKKFVVFQISYIFIHCANVVFIVCILKGEGIGKIVADAVAIIFMGLLHLYVLKRNDYLQIKVNKPCLKRVLKFAIPLLPHSLSFWLKNGTDKIFITNMCGLYINGIYSMAITMGSIYTMLVNSFFSAYTPYLQKRLVGIVSTNEIAEKKSIVKLTYLLIILFLFVAILAVLGSWVILNFFVDSKYMDSFRLVPFVIMSLYIYTIYSFAVEFIYKTKKTLIIGAITFSCSIIQMALGYFLIKNIGVMGAVYSMIIGSALISGFMLFYSNKVYPMPWLSFFKKC